MTAPRIPGPPPEVGLGGFEPPTSRLSGVRSNQLSYRPGDDGRSLKAEQQTVLVRGLTWITIGSPKRNQVAPRKEVIQPQVPLRLPCYDFTPVTRHSLGTCLPKVSSATSGAPNSHGVTGGVYKARERIHRSVLISDY